ncbi:MAG: hypothetical protein N2376_04590 [Clostridia bacterium]|nr:hypothetical protein [Clostridia bacterium]
MLKKEYDVGCAMKQGKKLILSSQDIKIIKNYSKQNITDCLDEIAHTRQVSMWNEYELTHEISKKNPNQ